MNNTSARILVIDDDPDIGVMIKLMLEFKGYAVTLVVRGEGIANIIAENAIDLVIMDMLLSGVNGIDVCRELKQDKATNAVPVIMISAHPNAREICREAGADDFISKPFDMQDMLARIDNLVHQTN